MITDYINCTTYHWEDDISDANLMTVFIHYFDEVKQSMMICVIGTFQVIDKCAKTTIDNLKLSLQMIQLESKLRIVVSDNPSSMKSAFKDIQWSSCSAQYLALLQKWSFNQQKNKESPDKTKSIYGLIFEFI